MQKTKTLVSRSASSHPGIYIRANMPKALSVTEAAKILKVGRPALSNLLNGKARLSSEMAARFEKAFGLHQEKLLQLQAAHDADIMFAETRSIAVSSYIPPFLRIRARDIEAWSDKNISSRSLLPVFLRKLVHSTGRDLTLVDFPGNDHSETRGWDGKIDAGSATAWIPSGHSRWELGTDLRPKTKADGDYRTRTDAVSEQDRMATTFVFVTPRHWPGKNEWIKNKESAGEWKAVKAYDSSDLEQWLEQSIQCQTWFAEQIGLPTEGFRSLDEQWKRWASATEPELPKSLLLPATVNHETALINWLAGEREKPLIIGSDSLDEGLAFLCCLFDDNEPTVQRHRDRAIVFESREALRRLSAVSRNFIAIVATDEVERELGVLNTAIPAILVRPRNSVEFKPQISIDLPSQKAFHDALNSIGLGQRADELARESGGSPTVLRRRLAKVEALRCPAWGLDSKRAKMLAPLLLVGAWHAQSTADREILALLGNCKYEEIENQIAEFVRIDDSPVWSVGSYRGVASKIDALFAAHGAITLHDLNQFFFVAELVLSERDPALDLPEDQRHMAGWYGKTRDHSAALREGICETLVILAVHGNDRFQQRLGIDVSGRVDALITKLLTPLTKEKLYSQSSLLPRYAEASPGEFLAILEADLRCLEPQVFGLLDPASTGVFGSCPRAPLLWALETLAWKPEQLIRVAFLLARLAERKIDDNWNNKPENSLLSIFRCWMPQTAASLSERKKALQVLAARYPAVGWKVCRDQFEAGSRVGHYNARPQWRNDASGAGEPVTRAEIYEFARAALDLAVTWKSHDEETLSDLVANMQGLQQEDQQSIWNLVDEWAKTESSEMRKQVLRERIRRFAFTRRGKAFKDDIKDRARAAYSLLTPSDVVVRHQWLFAAEWVEESISEMEADLDYQEHEERIRIARIEALREIWVDRGIEGIQSLLRTSGALQVIGWHLSETIILPEQRCSFIAEVFQQSHELAARNDEVIAGFLKQLTPEDRLQIILNLMPTLTDTQLIRLLKVSPFESDTWRHLENIRPQMATSYWKEVHPGWVRKGSDVNEAVDQLLHAGRPRAAFDCAHFLLDNLETDRLKRLLFDIATVDLEPSGFYHLDAHNISSALSILEKRSGVTEEVMARLEYMYIRVINHSTHGIPNLERQLSKSPLMYMQLLALSYRRSDGGKDPEEWLLQESEQRETAASMAYALLERMKVSPGKDENGRIDSKAFGAWVKEVRDLCAQYGRVAIGDQMLGKLMAALPEGEDGIWPIEAAREVLEDIGSQDIATGIKIGRFNSRGAHFRAGGGDAERALAAKYRTWSKKLAELPYLSRVLENIAAGYDREAVREDSEAAIEQRLNR